MRNVVIIGGGLAGLISSLQLIRAGIACTVIEKKSYPFHRVCGEYVSGEAVPFLKASGLYPKEIDLPQINMFELSSLGGKVARTALDLGGFGISRHTFDHHLFQVAQKEGVRFLLNTEATSVSFADEQFAVTAEGSDLFADVVIGSFGKRSRIDVQQQREFLRLRSPYVGVKYHAKSEHPPNVIALHNFPRGYCGICRVDQGLTNICYLTHRDNVKRFGDIRRMEEAVLFTNPILREIFRHSEFVFERPEVINEISFETKGPVENHILMAGDAAGMITPVCGNGMAIAMHSGKIVSGFVQAFCQGRMSRLAMENEYRKAWNNHFRARLWFGRKVQRLFGNDIFSAIAAGLAGMSPALTRYIVSKTHGAAF